jgi:hypothetical protein
MLVKLERPRLREVFMHDLEDQTPTIRSIVSRHLCLKRHQQCTVAPRTAWLHGDFNVCIPISVSNWRSQRLMIRCPFPHMLGASHNSGQLDEKIRCEAATFAWISRHCETPIPNIWGFGLPGGLCVGRGGCFSYSAANFVSQFTSALHLPLTTRAIEHVRGLWAWLFRRPRYAPFVSRSRYPVPQVRLRKGSGHTFINYVAARHNHSKAQFLQESIASHVGSGTPPSREDRVIHCP